MRFQQQALTDTSRIVVLGHDDEHMSTSATPVRKVCTSSSPSTVGSSCIMNRCLPDRSAMMVAANGYQLSEPLDGQPDRVQRST